MLNPQFKAAAYRLAVIEHLTQYLTDQFLSSGDIAPKRQLICEHGLYADHVTPQDPFYEVIDWLRRLAARSTRRWKRLFNHARPSPTSVPPLRFNPHRSPPVSKNTRKRKPVEQRAPGNMPPVHARLALMENQIHRISEVLDMNSRAFSNGLQFTEATLVVLQRVLNDMTSGTVRLQLVDGQRMIDFISYMQEHALCMMFADFAAWLKSIYREPTPSVDIIPATDVATDTIVFGGTGG